MGGWGMPQARTTARPHYPLACLEVETPPREHGDPFEPDPCKCLLCQTWRERLAKAAESTALCALHGRSCFCSDCKVKRKDQIALLIAENIRDIWTEFSWIAKTRGWDVDWPEWLMEELGDSGRGLGWYSSQMTHMTLGWWTARWELWRRARGRPPIYHNLGDWRDSSSPEEH